MLTPLDDVLDALDDLLVDCPKPLVRSHCDYCLTWLVIMEDILRVGDDE